jgi:cytochrome c oxidase cbb3-type subunit IV
MTLDINLLREGVTVVSFLVFVAIVAYAIHPRNRARFDEAARLPLEDGERE